MTPCLSARSVASLCGGTPSAAANVPGAASADSSLRHTFAVPAQGQAAPSASSERTTGLRPAEEKGAGTDSEQGDGVGSDARRQIRSKYVDMIGRMHGPGATQGMATHR
jgi:hypothetical protein